jgi:hypothetical protein
MFQHVRTRAYHAHVTQQHINELRRFVQTCLAHNLSPSGDSTVALGGLQYIRMLVLPHRPELVTLESPSVQSRPFLHEEQFTGHGTLRDDEHNKQHKRKHKAQETERKDNVEPSFQPPVPFVFQ